MTHPDPRAALEEILERHKEMHRIGATLVGGPFCDECSAHKWHHNMWVAYPCDAARVTTALLGVVGALGRITEAAHQCGYNYNYGDLESMALDALARAAQDLEPK